jgi:uncharacterized membrane protein YqjE
LAATDGSGQKLGETVNEIAERASLLVREEIELARAEITQKITSLAKAAGVAVAAGIFLGVAMIYLLHGVAWAFSDFAFKKISIGFFIVGGILALLGALSGYLAYRWFQRGSPPTPEMAIDEAKRIRETVSETTSSQAEQP